jgi:hypothetical protein
MADSMSTQRIVIDLNYENFMSEKVILLAVTKISVHNFSLLGKNEPSKTAGILLQL